MEYAIDVAQACRAAGVKSVAVTAGEICEEPRAEFYAHMDAANVDLKGFTERFYHEVCAATCSRCSTRSSISSITRRFGSRSRRCSSPAKTIPTPSSTPSANGSSRQLGPDVPVHFTAFHPDFRMLDKPRTPPETLTRARDIAIANGIRYAYTGNVHDRNGGTTWCHHCGQCLIERDWYTLGEWHVTPDGRCDKCGLQIPGHFDAGRALGDRGARPCG